MSGNNDNEIFGYVNTGRTLILAGGVPSQRWRPVECADDLMAACSDDVIYAGSEAALSDAIMEMRGLERWKENFSLLGGSRDWSVFRGKGDSVDIVGSGYMVHLPSRHWDVRGMLTALKDGIRIVADSDTSRITDDLNSDATEDLRNYGRDACVMKGCVIHYSENGAARKAAARKGAITRKIRNGDVPHRVLERICRCAGDAIHTVVRHAPYPSPHGPSSASWAAGVALKMVKAMRARGRLRSYEKYREALRETLPYLHGLGLGDKNSLGELLAEDARSFGWKIPDKI